MRSFIPTAALAFLLCAVATGADAASTASLGTSGGVLRRLWGSSSNPGFCWTFWNCPKPKPGPKCAPCATPCPAGFKYTEDCAYWWWQSDKTSCVPERSPAGAVPVNQDVVQRGICSYAFTKGGEGKFGGEPAACPSGYVDQGVVASKDNCCQPPLWGDRGRRMGLRDERKLLLAQLSCSNPKTFPYGYYKTRRCVKKNPVTVFKINEPANACPTWALQEWQTTFETCSHCAAGASVDGDAVMGAGPQKMCWLPYSKNAEGNCFAYDGAGVGWWQKTGAGTRRGTFKAVKGGAEQPMMPWVEPGVSQ